jgi:hypothetical protein
MRLLILLVCATALSAADAYPVIGITDAGRLVVQYRGIPVSFELAHVEAPADEVARRAYVDQLRTLSKNGQVELVHDASFGVDELGVGRVHAKLKSGDLSELLVGKGLAKLRSGQTSHPSESLVKMAQDKASKAKLGLWSTGDTAASSTAVAKADPKPAASPKAAFVSELGSNYYYPAGHSAVSGVNPQRLIGYASEDLARKAGKRPNTANDLKLPEGDGEDSADKAFAMGKDIVQKAAGQGATPERDQLYAQAYLPLTRAMNIYSALVEKRPNDEALAEKMRTCMQMRYSTVKYRRFD